MRLMQKSFSTFCLFVVALAAPATAAVGQGRGSCAQIRAACQSAGFVQGAANLGVGLQVDCIIPIVLGTAQRPRARKPLPQVDPQLVAECTAGDPNFGRPHVPPTESVLQPMGAGRLLPRLSYSNENRRQGYGASVSPLESIRLPEPELLEHQTAPDCEFKSDTQTDNEAAFRAMKLDYEQQCYRQSEYILRARMERLQDAVRKTIESLKSQEKASAH
jgi:hypothetical protein